MSARSDGPGRGSEFVVALPFTPDEETGASAPAQRELPQAIMALRVLVVDDNVDAAVILAETLRALGHQVAVAHDGPQALEVAETLRPDVAVLDLGLPVMDGYELAARLRASVGCERLIALTGYGQDSDRRRSRKAGFAKHLVKPVDVSLLIDAIEGRSPGPRDE